MKAIKPPKQPNHTTRSGKAVVNLYPNGTQHINGFGAAVPSQYVIGRVFVTR